MAEKISWYTTDRHGDKVFNTKKLIKTIIIAAIIIVAALILNPISFISRDERGVRLFGGAVVSEMLTPGIQLHVPLFGEIRTVSIRPREVPVQIDVNDNGAISKDNQIIGVSGTVIWKYSETDIPRIFKEFPSESDLKSIIARNVTQAVKTTIGNYSIYDIAMNQAKIANEIELALKRTVVTYPVDVLQSTVENFNWSPEFDRRINATMEATQQVKEAEQRALIAEQENRRLGIEAEAKARAEIAAAEGRKRTAELDAEALLAKANGERAAKIAEGEGINRYNQLIAQNLSIEIRLRELSIAQTEAERWNGVRVPSYIPLTPNGGVVTLPIK
jgi:regulator of protease activity HflC (stomatin/prohibitin superfamily)